MSGMSSVSDGGNTYVVRAFGEPVARGRVLGWLQFQLNVPGGPTVSTERRNFESNAAVTRWARGLERDQLGTELAGALARWKRGNPFQPRLLETTGPVMDGAGAPYHARIFSERSGHLWVAWLEFEPRADGPIWVTAHETSQPSLPALVYWVQGLEPLYFPGALERARWWSHHSRGRPRTHAAEARGTAPHSWQDGAEERARAGTRRAQQIGI
jgi:hypothetical protein